MKTSPKQPQPERHRDWYPYYAGFTERFVGEVLDKHAAGAESVIDPWNGSGTTTVSCAHRGIRAAGVDINPALTVIARARLAPRSIYESLSPEALAILDVARQLDSEPEPDDMLFTWMRSEAVSRVRSIQVAVHEALGYVPTRNGRSPLRDLARLAETMPPKACFYYSALFAATRDLLRRYRATNPTWLLAPRTPRHRTAPSWATVGGAFVERVAYFGERLGLSNEIEGDSNPVVRTGTATQLAYKSETFDGAVTSPPYATRIDYVKGVLPELALLGASKEDVELLRRLSTGSPVVSGVDRPTQRLSSRYGCTVLEAIREHSSKGSHRYYHPWMSRYLDQLQAGLVELARVVSATGTISVVVQDSHYKEVHIDLQKIVVETMEEANRPLAARQDFTVRHHRAHMNPRARKHLANRQSKESLLVFG